MEIILNGHPEKIVDDLRKAADAVLKGRTGYLAFTDDEGGDHELQFVSDASTFGLEDKLYADEIEA